MSMPIGSHLFQYVFLSVYLVFIDANLYSTMNDYKKLFIR